MSRLPFPVYDADNHLYEPEEAFTRYLPARYANDFYFAEVKGRKKLVINGQLSAYIPNPTFEVVAAPGAYETWYRGENKDNLTLREMTGKPIRPPEEWRSGEGRLKTLDKHGIHAAMIFPTLASVIEERLGHKAGVAPALFHSLNQWLDDEWGFAREDRLFSVGMVNLSDVDAAVAEVDYLISRGARAIAIRPAPVPLQVGSTSFGYEQFDPFWARCAEANLLVCLHASDSGYDRITKWWTGGQGEFEAFTRNAFSETMDLLGRPIADSMSALICHGVFKRHPNLRVASVENGSSWLVPLIKRLEMAYGRLPGQFHEHPRDTFERHIFVAPFYEDDLDEVKSVLPVERILFGSDFPHPEGTHEPLDYVKEFDSLTAEEQEKVFSSNLKRLLEGKRD
ncbi:amidohydrolase family protein [Novosphingobium pentaromativorans]|uniref:amidohydrolase family protein n=1 Tax=Novosphingobium pentaromativorans TaxID=205844 RepID=UPI0002F92360|nr:amidohydrolase family protein [Novosphingobium pentaromativorans]AIT81451.1 amidohydrolase [Novosphingobium pentaromativorans US6-1]